MTTAQHTPGPWIIANDGTIEAHTRGLVGHLKNASDADARLIAAAPDLLAALEAADRWVAMYHNLPGHDAASQCMTRVIRAAIARATKEDC